MINSDKLKGRMTEKRITQARLAEKLGIRACTINQKINNVRALNLDEAEKICEILEIPADEFGEYFFA